MRWFPLLVISLFAFASPSPAQSTQPAAEGWPAVADRFAHAAVEGDASKALTTLSDDIAVTLLDGKPADTTRLLARARQGTLITVRSYAKAPEALASDLAEDVQKSPIPDESKRPLMLRDAPHAVSSNETAARWITSVLRPNPGDSLAIAVIALPPAKETAPPQLLFILMRGNEAHVKALAFGSPMGQ